MKAAAAAAAAAAEAATQLWTVAYTSTGPTAGLGKKEAAGDSHAACGHCCL